ncbi:hypothetical protein DY218_05265 [Streptomyces triticagri]|uniref:CdiI immunity protein domain-containing protein n=1 Tax=Streptomyces triticagri TaxID=2293568 RepID=A0A372M9T1_9ACTN|nr:hypothetical protein DY218_05265 [Streptomyces triticagri]
MLNCYASHTFAFTDTPAVPSPALLSYLRAAAADPGRAVSAVAQIDDLLEAGLFSDEVANDVDLMPRIRPPEGMTVEQCLRVTRAHLAEFIRAPHTISLERPTSRWEWDARFPELSQFIGTRFHQDFSYDYTSHSEAIDEYFEYASPEEVRTLHADIERLLGMLHSDAEFEEAAEALGMDVYPPDDQTFRTWLTHTVLPTVQRHLAA